MKISNHSAVPVYTISGSSTARPLPEWLARKRKRSLKHDPEFANRIELLQDFEFEEASQCIRVSDDGQWLMSTGTYKPQIHTHYLPHLALSFSRHTISLNTTFVLLSSDYTKSLHLQSDRSLEFHTQAGCHYRTRIPRFGRDLVYDNASAEALIPAVGLNEDGNGEVFRLNLELGRFMKGYEVDVGDNDASVIGGSGLQGGIGAGAVNTAAIAEGSHNLLAFGTSLGTVEFWDPRSRTRAGIVHNVDQNDRIEGRQETTALTFDKSGLGIAAGSSSGLINLYDLRSPKPVLKKDQGYGYPIQDIIYLSSGSARSQVQESKILSSDKRIIKIWDAQDGSPWTSVEPAVDINSVAWCKDTGMVLTANEGQQQHAFLIPQLGPAPKWCSFLDNLVEEMAEDPSDPNAYQTQRSGEIYDSYKFLTVEQLETLNLSHLIGTTSLLRPYMHGYFVAQRLYEEAKLIADPFVFEEERNKRVKEKIEAERDSRIRGNKKITTKVNQRLADRIAERQAKEERRQARRLLKKADDGAEAAEKAADENSDAEIEQPESQKKPNINPLADPRFSRLFTDEAFAIDENSLEFRQLNPSTKPSELTKPNGTSERKLTAVEQEALDAGPGSSSDLDSGSDSESESLPTAPAQKAKPSPSTRISDPSYKKSGHRPLQPTMKVSSSNGSRPRKDISFGQRAHETRPAKHLGGVVVGEREISFTPGKKKKQGGGAVIEKGPRRVNKDRRSASGNVMRGL